MKRGHMTAAWVAVTALLLLSGCGSLGLNVNRDPGTGKNGAAQLVLDQRLIDTFKGIDEAVAELVRQGVSEKTARRRIVNAELARGGQKEQR